MCVCVLTMGVLFVHIRDYENSAFYPVNRRD